jgi:hypothetical protein
MTTPSSWRCRRCQHHNPSHRDICRGWQCNEPKPGHQPVEKIPDHELPVREALLALARIATKRQPYTALISQLAKRFEGGDTALLEWWMTSSHLSVQYMKGGGWRVYDGDKPITDAKPTPREALHTAARKQAAELIQRKVSRR